MNRDRLASASVQGLALFVGVWVLGSAWFGVLALSRWYAVETSAYDLGIFSQSAEAWSQGRLPHSQIRGLPLLGEHFSPIMALTGPLWWLWPDPRVLLVLQAVLFGATAAMLVTCAAQTVHGWLLAGFTALVLTSYASLSAIEFDFHEVAFAPPLMAALGIGLLRRRFWCCLLASLGLLTVKEDLGLTVIAAGVTWLLLTRDNSDQQRDRRRAAALTTLGVIGVVTAFLTIYLVGSSTGEAFHVGYLSRLASPDATGTIGLFQLLASLPARLVPAAAFAISTLIVGLRSPLILLAIPTLLWRAVSSTQTYWQLYWHYDAVLWPVSMLAIVHSKTLSPDRLSQRWKLIVAVAAAASLVLGLSRIVGQPGPQNLISPDPKLAALTELSARLPSGADVAAQDQLAPYLIPRHRVSVLDKTSTQRVDYIFLTDKSVGGATNFRAPLCSRLKLLSTASATFGVTIQYIGHVYLISYPVPTRPPLTSC